MKDFIRLDILVSKKANVSREKAKELILNNSVSICNKTCTKSGQKFDPDSNISIEIPKKNYVSRGGIKLDRALSYFNIDVNNAICMDIGSSTGGFTDCLLQNGAKKIFAIDSGYNQLSEKLRSNKNVVSLEKTNIRNLDLTLFNNIDIVVIDVSFISITKVLCLLNNFILDHTDVIALIKPQFEAGLKHLNKKGIVKDKKVHLKVLEQVYNSIIENKLIVQNIVVSPISGGDGNIEYLLHIKKNENNSGLDLTKFIDLAKCQVYGS